VLTVSWNRWRTVGLGVVLAAGVVFVGTTIEIARTTRSDRKVGAYCRSLSHQEKPSEIRQGARRAGFHTHDVPESEWSPAILEIETEHWLPSICSVRHHEGAVVSITLDPWYE
jgi:hypothetical protein